MTVAKTKVRFAKGNAITYKAGVGGVSANIACGGDPASPELAVFTFAVSSASAGDVTITLGGLDRPDYPSNLVVTVPLLTGDVDTAAHVATKVAAATYTGWTATALSNVVTFTSSVNGPHRNVHAFAQVTSTGVTATEATTAGHFDGVKISVAASRNFLGVPAHDALVGEDVVVYRNQVVKVNYSASAAYGDPLILSDTGFAPSGATPDARTVVGRCEQTMSGAGLGWAYIGV